jgi:hypothetical protein
MSQMQGEGKENDAGTWSLGWSAGAMPLGATPDNGFQPDEAAAGHESCRRSRPKIE